MNKFVEQLDSLKTTFAELPEECLSEAIDRMDQTVEQLAQSVVFVDDESQAQLVDMGINVVQDFLSPTHETFAAPSTSSEDFYFELESTSDATSSTTLYCYTCGDAFNNRKALYRHGKATQHQTRPLRYNRKNQAPAKPPEINFEIPNTVEIQETKNFDPVESLLNLEEMSNFVENSPEDDSTKKLICYECEASFKNRKGLYRHGKQTNHRTRLMRAPNIKGGPIRCTNCPYSTDTEANLKRHQRRNHHDFSMKILGNCHF